MKHHLVNVNKGIELGIFDPSDLDVCRLLDARPNVIIPNLVTLNRLGTTGFDISFGTQ